MIIHHLSIYKSYSNSNRNVDFFYTYIKNIKIQFLKFVQMQEFVINIFKVRSIDMKKMLLKKLMSLKQYTMNQRLNVTYLIVQLFHKLMTFCCSTVIRLKLSAFFFEYFFLFFKRVNVQFMHHIRQIFNLICYDCQKITIVLNFFFFQFLYFNLHVFKLRNHTREIVSLSVMNILHKRN